MTTSKFTTSQPASPGIVARKSSASAAALEQGIQFLHRNQLGEARRCFDHARQSNPNDPIPHNCLGIVARSERRLSDAMNCFHRALELNPQFAEAHNNLGNAFRDAGQIREAAECYRRALQIKPQFAEAHNNLGVVLLARGEVAEAIACFDQAIAMQPLYAEAHNNLANAYRQRGERIAAAASLSTALQLRPHSPEIHNNLANVLRETGQFETARDHYVEAVRLKPDFAQAWDNLGTVLIDLEQGTEAIAAYEQAARLDAPRVENLVNLGNAYRLVGRTTGARASYQKAACLEPNNPWHNVRCAALCPPAFRSRAEMDQYRWNAQTVWSRLAEERNRRGPLTLDERLVEPEFAWQFLDGDLRPLKEAYAGIFGDGWPRPRTIAAARLPRIGIVVTRGHEGLFLRSLAGVLQRIKSARFEWVIVCPVASEGMIRRGIERDVELVLMPDSFPAAADAIRVARLSVLYYWEIGTDATNYFLPFLQLAPLQCTSWGVQVTSGIRHVDYYLGSDLVESDRAAEHYSERLLLSPTLLTYQVPPSLPHPAKKRADFGFHDHQRLYVCAQQLGKFHADFDDRLAGILRRDSQALIIATADRYGFATDIVRSRLVETIPDVADRVRFLPRLEFADYLQLLNVADVLLDPPHFGGVNSTFDALAIGQPVITLPTEYQRGRFTAACLRQVGLTETIARDADQYVELAVALAADRRRQADLREQIRQSAGALFRDDQSVREHERLFERLVNESAKSP
jgi:predicted O-linked N-acetylglucosamine transferase (SPINDLY family)